jgi:HEAT repeat protein
MTKRSDYIQHLKDLPDWDEYLLQESGLPGPRANLELIHAVADIGSEDLFLRYLQWTSDRVDTNAPPVILAVSGAVGLGRLLVEGHLKYFATLRSLASDSRWRVREGVAMALQRYGMHDMERLLAEMELWSTGHPYEQRAVVAGLCEPVLLKNKEPARRVIELLEQITDRTAAVIDRRSDAFAALRKALAYGWSVAVAAEPEYGFPILQALLESPDKDIRWIGRENMKKNRLKKWINSP